MLTGTSANRPRSPWTLACALTCLTLALQAGCSKSSAPGGRMSLTVTSDLADTDADQVRIRIQGSDLVERTVAHPPGTGPREVAHYTLAFDPRANTTFTVTAAALSGGATKVEQARQFVGNDASNGASLDVRLERACVAKVCAAGTSCVAGQCAALTPPDAGATASTDGGRDARGPGPSDNRPDAAFDAPSESSSDAPSPPRNDDAQTPPPAPCQATEIRCGGACVARTTEHCGDDCNACPAVNGGQVACVNGQCTTTCEAGKVLCAGACVVEGTPCNGVCPAKTHNCDSECRADDATASCGDRCTPCQPPPNARSLCAAGKCDFKCEPGYHRCGEACFADTDPDHCGTDNSCTYCARPTGATPVCSNNTCGIACGTLKNCGDHCAACCAAADCTGFPGATGVCGANGTCSFGACKPGFGDCNNNKADGCEVNLTTSVDNCGACARKCSDWVSGAPSTYPSNIRCEASQCAISCYPAPYSTTCREGPHFAGTACEPAFENPVTGQPNYTKTAACYVSCASGYFECDGKRDNGCESTVKATGCEISTWFNGE